MPVKKSVVFNVVVEKFGENGDKTGWTYIIIPSVQSEILFPGRRKSFRVKGLLDKHEILRVAVMPDGKGNFIMPLNQQMRKATGKSVGHQLKVTLTVDESEATYDEDFLVCLADDPEAKEFFQNLSNSHRSYFSKWIESAKTNHTKETRIARCLNALSRRMNYAEMLREGKEKN